MRLQRQASSRGNLNAGLKSLTAIGAQLPGNTLLEKIAPVGERLRGPVQNSIVKKRIEISVVLGKGCLITPTHALAREGYSTSIALQTVESVCMPWIKIGASMTSP